MSRSRRGQLLLAVMMVVGTLALPPTASVLAEPTDTFIGFGFAPDGRRLGSGELIADTYLAEKGVLFADTVNLHCSPTNAECNAGHTGTGVGAGALRDEFFRRPMELRFSRVQDSVTLWLRAMPNEAVAMVPWSIDGYDRNGAFVRGASATVGTTWRSVTIDSPGGEQGIARLIVSGGHEGSNRLLIDDVRAIGDDTNPRGDRDLQPPRVSISAPNEGQQFSTSTIPVHFTATDDERLDFIRIAVREWDGVPGSGSSGDVISSAYVCGRTPAAPCPLTEYESSGLTVSVPAEPGYYVISVYAKDLGAFGSSDFVVIERTASPSVGTRKLIATELNQGSQGPPTMVDDIPGAPQSYRSHAPLLPGKHLLIRQYFGRLNADPVPALPPRLPVTITYASGENIRYSLSPLPAPDPGPTAPPEVSPSGSDWIDQMWTMRTDLRATGNYAVDGSLTEGATSMVLGDVDSRDRMVAQFDEPTQLGINLIGLYDDANLVPAARQSQFEEITLPYVEAALPYSSVDILSYHRAHWSALPTMANAPHDPSCAVASAMYHFTFGHERAVYPAETENTWVVDGAIAWNSGRALRGCHVRTRDIERFGSDFSASLQGDNFTHEAGHAHALGHATDLHSEGWWGAEDWPWFHGHSSPDGRSVFGAALRRDPSTNEWDVQLLDPCPGAADADRAPMPVNCNAADAGRLHELMSYGGNTPNFPPGYTTRRDRWPSLINYRRIYNAVTNGSIGSPTDPRFSGIQFARSPGGEVDTAMLVAGRAFEDGTFVLDGITTTPVEPAAFELPDIDHPDFAVELLDADGVPLATRPGVIGATDTPDGEGVHFVVPFAAKPDAVRARVVIDGEEIAAIDRSSASPVIGNVQATPVDADGRTTISWSTVDAEGDAPTTIIWVSYDNGHTWLPGAWVQPGQPESISLDVHDAPAGTRVLARLVASDGFNAATAESYLDETGPDCTAARAHKHVIQGGKDPGAKKARWVRIKIKGLPKGQTAIVTAIRQDEPAGSAPDASGVGRVEARVKAERLSAGDGRMYHIDFMARTAEGATCTGSLTVPVPRKANVPVIDQGPLYSSTEGA